MNYHSVSCYKMHEPSRCLYQNTKRIFVACDIDVKPTYFLTDVF
jgi:hypothetical protein